MRCQAKFLQFYQSVRTFTTRGLPGGDVQILGGDFDRVLNLITSTSCHQEPNPHKPFQDIYALLILWICSFSSRSGLILNLLDQTKPQSKVPNTNQIKENSYEQTNENSCVTRISMREKRRKFWTFWSDRRRRETVPERKKEKQI